ncbi:hypothetical protein BKA69DRAFT_1056803 [Paraphysoderma sedebokerense]|nr:hypothetical protein BKA69DRAFT_1056803 [Paraphysoderma sedebokerense]
MTVIQNTFVYKNTSIETLISEYSQFLSRLRNETDDNTPTIAEAQNIIDNPTPESLRTLITKYAKESNFMLASFGADKDIESYFTLLLTCFKMLSESMKKEEIEVELFKSVVKGISESTSERGNLKLRLLSTIYNTLSVSSPLRYEVFKTLVQVATKHNNLSVITPQIPSISSYITQWQSTPSQARELYSLMSASLKSQGFTREAYNVYLLHLATFEKESNVDAKAKDAVNEAIVLGLNEDGLFDFDELFQLKAVQAFNNEKMVQLLKIFVLDNLTAYKKFIKDNSALEKSGLNLAILLRKITLLTLASIATEYVNSESPMTYETISKSLECPESEIEIWIIDGIKYGLLSGKLNQIEKKFVVTRTTHRTFTKTEWSHLSARLHSWKSNLQEIAQVIKNAKAGNLGQAVGH